MTIFKRYQYTKDTLCNKGPTQANGISSTFNSFEKCVIKEHT